MDLTGARWRKSTKSGGNGGNCLEVADNLPGVVGVRDSKDPTGPALVFGPSCCLGPMSSPPGWLTTRALLWSCHSVMTSGRGMTSATTTGKPRQGSPGS